MRREPSGCDGRRSAAPWERPSAAILAALLAAAAVADTPTDTEWPFYGNDPGGSRYVELDQITPDNVADLELAWTYRTGDFGDDIPSRERMAFEATPILLDGVLYVSTPYGQVHAIDAGSGEGIWRFDPKLPNDRHYSENTSRGVSAWRDPDAPAGAPCALRILYGTLDARLIALDAATGAPCAGFGVNGTVDLNEGSRPRDPGGYLVSSPPVLWRDLVITGSAIGDNRAVDLELGIVRAFHARTGELVWSWDPIPRDPDNPVYAEWSQAAARKTGAANAWSVLSVDVDRGLVFVPVGSASPDFYGGERPGDNRHANSLVALSAATGEVVWARQFVHHDVWDYDLPAQPVLAELERDGATVPAVIQATKMGMLFVLHRETGEPLFGIEERPVPQGGVPGEVLSPTQPFSALPPLVRHEPLTPDDAWGLTFWDRGRCAERIASYRSEGIYTPPSTQGTIVWPGYAGGSNWGSVSFDPERQLVVANVMHLAFVVQLIPRDEFDTLRSSGAHPDSEFARQTGTPYGMRRELITSPLGVPCTAPPWSTLAAMDLRTGRIRWQVPLGTTRDMAPWPFWYIDGAPSIGGSIVTSSGLVFIGATADDYLRAFDVETGAELWRGRLPAGGQAIPMSYRLGGRQYVVIAAGGHGGAGTTRGDYVVAFALPRRS
ncbi:MAG TPA: pyrroloquinoline quinone-dependent dehydrogenase [Pseudomonadales bacterium]